MNRHRYTVDIEWTGNAGAGTQSYSAYRRDHVIAVPGKPPIEGSSDPAFLGDPSRHNPEELLVASLAACHMLWYLHLCAENGLVVTGYRDSASGTLALNPDGSGAFSSVTLRPEVTLDARHGKEDVERARELHESAHRYCFIARSMAFEVGVEPKMEIAPKGAARAAPVR
jgi:organic hydroperoxide reductase OsmC/OhrA